MEDPSEKVGIKDYSSYSLLEDEESSDIKSSKLGWVLNTGLNLGKKFVITGFLISSVPLVLPLLVVVSALGFVVAVPFGFVLASYAGAEKLMSKLLPSPSPSQIDYDEVEEEEEEEALIAAEKGGKENRGEGINDGSEITINDNGAKVEEKLGNEKQFNDGRVGKADEELNVGEAPLEKHEDGAKEQDKLGSGDQLADEKVGKDYEEANVVEEKHEDETPQNANAEELNKRERESEGQNAGQDVKSTEPMLEAQTVNVVENKDKRDDGSKKEVQRDSEDKNGKMEKNVPAARGTTEEKKRQTNSKGKSSSMESDKRAKTKTATTVQKSSGRKKGDKKREKASASEVVAEERMTGSDNVESSQVLASKKDVDQSTLPSGKQDVDIFSEENEKPAGLKTNEKDNKNVVVLASETSKDENKHSLESAALIGLPELKNHEEIPELEGDNDAFGADHDLHSDKERLRDEKIWKEIDAIRVIVGFQTPQHTSYFEELKALYVFTGIVPPSSFITTDSSDLLEEFYSKLQFLKSVIGVK